MTRFRFVRDKFTRCRVSRAWFQMLVLIVWWNTKC